MNQNTTLKMFLLSEKEIAGLRYMTCLSVKNPLGQLKFVRLFRVTVLNLHVIIMKPKFKLINSAARLEKIRTGAYLPTLTPEA